MLLHRLLLLLQHLLQKLNFTLQRLHLLILISQMINIPTTSLTNNPQLLLQFSNLRIQPIPLLPHTIQLISILPQIHLELICMTLCLLNPSRFPFKHLFHSIHISFFRNQLKSLLLHLHFQITLMPSDLVHKFLIC